MAHIDSKTQIRVLELLPGRIDDEIKCEFRPMAMSLHGTYEALSYVWGPTEGRETISVGQQKRLVTPNLYHALNRLRYKDKKRTLWIDQLCINQWDNEEKANQVDQMRLIYKRCSQCLIWLGEITGDLFTVEDAKHALDFLRIMANPQSELSLDIPLLSKGGNVGERVRAAFRAMTVDGNPWWTRIWTTQEAVLPSQASVLWGPFTVPWSLFDGAALTGVKRSQILNHHDLQTKPQSEFNRVVANFAWPVRGLAICRTREERPMNLLRRWRYRKATDPRDKVYALMGLFSTNPFPSVQSCNYSIDTSLLYARVTLDLLRSENGLRPLVGLRGEPQVTAGLPTWAVDLTRFPYTKKLPWNWWNHSHRYGMFRATQNVPMSLSSSDNEHVLVLKGIRVDRIEIIGTVLGEQTWEALSNEVLIKIVKEWKILFENSQTARSMYENDPRSQDVFWQTMLGDLIMEEFPVRSTRPQDARLFQTFLDTPVRNIICTSFYDMVVNQAFFITEQGYIGIGPPTTLPGDEVWVLFGGNVPFILRAWEGKDTSLSADGIVRKFVGDAYVHGIMDGEVVRNSQELQTEVHLV
jgi:hypothetical protein